MSFSINFFIIRDESSVDASSTKIISISFNSCFWIWAYIVSIKLIWFWIVIIIEIFGFSLLIKSCELLKDIFTKSLFFISFLALIISILVWFFQYNLFLLGKQDEFFCSMPGIFNCIILSFIIDSSLRIGESFCIPDSDFSLCSFWFISYKSSFMIILLLSSLLNNKNFKEKNKIMKKIIISIYLVNASKLQLILIFSIIFFLLISLLLFLLLLVIFFNFILSS